MARFRYTGTARDRMGSVISGATATVYEAGTTTLATIYDQASGGSAVTGSAVTTGSGGDFEFYVDTADYGKGDLFDIKVTKANYLSFTKYGVGLEGVARYVNVVSKSTAYTATAADSLILVSGTTTITLMSAADVAGLVLNIKNVGTATVTIDGDGAETIDGNASIDLTLQYESVTLASDGSNWHII